MLAPLLLLFVCDVLSMCAVAGLPSVANLRVASVRLLLLVCYVPGMDAVVCAPSVANTSAVSTVLYLLLFLVREVVVPSAVLGVLGDL